MPPTGQIIACFLLGVSLCAIALHVFRHYRDTFASDAESTMTTDMLSVILFGEWGAPVLLALLVFLIGVFCFFVSGLMVWSRFT